MTSAGAFLDRLLDRYLQAMHARTADNYDAHRFGPDGAARFEVVPHREYLKFVVVHHARLFETWQRLADARSRALFEQLLLYRMAGHLHVRLDANGPERAAAWKRAPTLAIGPAAFHTEGRNPLQRFAVPFRGVPITVDLSARAVSASFIEAHYFYERDGVVIAPQPGDVALDLGACLGDTALAFAAAVGPSGRVFTFEFVPDHLAVLHSNLALNPALRERITVVPVAVGGADNGHLPVSASDRRDVQVLPGARVQGLSPDTAVPIRSIDGLVAAGVVPRVDFLKMDIEGAELDALEGAKATIDRFRPRLAISAYHKWDDYFTLADWMVRRGYELHLDHHSIHAEETVFYARRAP